MPVTKSQKDKPNILIVDDDPDILELIQETLGPAGYNIHTAADGETALNIINQLPISLVILDIVLPDIDGDVICRRIRQQWQVPIIMLTGIDAEDEKIHCLAAGADDYITKPFSPREMGARVMAVLRRSSASASTPNRREFQYLDLNIDFRRHAVKVDNQEIELSLTEYAILKILALNAGKLVTNEQLLQEVWGNEYIQDLHLLHVNISRLRQKLKNKRGIGGYIETKQGLGYILKGR
jgi:two-component system, OmpR family, response regulator VicR